jgi:hypothetical protein
MQVLCVGVQVISAIADYFTYGLDPALAKALSPTFIRHVVTRRADPMKCQPDDALVPLTGSRALCRTVTGRPCSPA